MPPDLPSRSGNSQDQVDRKQRVLDGADETVDGKIEGRASEQLGAVEKQKLTQTYIGKVNDLQGSIGAARRTVEVRRDSKAADWEELDSNCAEVERELVERLEKIDPSTMKEGVDAFDAALAALEAKLSTPAKGKETSKEAPAKASPAVMRLLKSLNLDEKESREFAEDPAKLRSLQETAKDKGGRIGETLARMKEEENGLLKQLADETGKSTYDFVDTFTDKTLKDNESAKATIARIKKVRANMQPLAQQKQTVDTMISTLDIALRLTEADASTANKDTDMANRQLTKLLELNGNDLKDIDPEITQRAQTAAEALRSEGKLSSTEEAILFSDPSSPEALSRAIQAKADSSPTADIIDQLGAKETFKVGAFEDVAKHFGSGSLQFHMEYQNRDVTGALSNTLYTTLTYADKELKVLASPQAKTKLENIPEGMQPVILKPVQSISIKNKNGGRGGMRYELGNAPSTFILQDYDVGYVDKNGKVFQNKDGQEVDATKSPNKDAIESQLRVQRGFTLTDYKPKYELRDGKGKPYGSLRNIRTQSGVSVEGVRVEPDVQQLIEQTPPDGKTLVLKRIPTAVQLREAESTPGRNGTRYQRVLTVDRIRREDLAYASTDGANLSTVDIDGKNAKTESAEDAKKEQEEESSDIERVLDRNPSVHYVKRTASTIQQTFGHLQSFLEASQKGSAREAFVSFAREEAKPTLDLLRDPQTRQNVDEARRVLRALKGSNGVAVGGAEKEIDTQLKALDQFTALLTNPAVLSTLETIMDASKFDEDSWASFAANELPVIAAAIAGAVAAAAIIVATMGSAAPFIAIATAAAAAGGGIVGSELGKEALFQFKQRTDADVISGKKTFTTRSRVGKYAEGTAQFNAETGQYEGPDFLRDVTNPLAVEFATSFAITLGTMGLGNLAGSGLSKILQNSKVVERLAARSDIMKIVARKLTAANANKEVLIKAANLKDALGRAIKELPKEVLEEGGEELQESILENICNQIDVALSATDGQDGQLGLGAAAGLLLAIGKSTKIGKKTLTYSVGADVNPTTIEARKAELAAQLKTEGAEVTDLGRGYLSVRYAVQAEDGSTQYETVQLMPVKRNAPSEENNALLAEDIPDSADVSGDAPEDEDASIDLNAPVSGVYDSEDATPPVQPADSDVQAAASQQSADSGTLVTPGAQAENSTPGFSSGAVADMESQVMAQAVAVSEDSADSEVASSSNDRGFDSTAMPDKPIVTPDATDLTSIGNTARQQVNAPSDAEVSIKPLGEGGMGVVAGVNVVGDAVANPESPLQVLESNSYATKVAKETKSQDNTLTKEREAADIILAKNKENVLKAVDAVAATLPEGIPDDAAAALIAERVGQVMPISTPALTAFLLIQRRDNPGISWENAMGRALDVFRGPVPRAYDSQNPYIFTADLVSGKDSESINRGLRALPTSTRETQAYGYVLAARSATDAGLVYRDLKPANTITDANGVVRLIDLGLATKAGEVKSAGGTPVTGSPEQLKGGKSQTQSDVFNAGAVLYKLFSRNDTFPIEDVAQAKKIRLGTAMKTVLEVTRLTEGDIAQAVEQNIDADPEVKALIGRMLSVDPAQRPTMQEVQDVLYSRVRGRLDADRRVIGDIVRREEVSDEPTSSAPAIIGKDEPTPTPEAASQTARIPPATENTQLPTVEVQPQPGFNLDAAIQNKDTRSIKDHLNTSDVTMEERTRIAGGLLGLSLNPKEQAAIVKAYDLPGDIDNMTSEQEVAKQFVLLKEGGFSLQEVKILLLAGLCQKPTAKESKAGGQNISDPEVTLNQAKGDAPSTPQQDPSGA